MPHKPSALANLGATCYINTTIQCLGHCRPFLEFMLMQKEYDGKLLGEVHDLYKELFIGHHSLIPRKFIGALNDKIKSIDIHEQNDINEFLMILLDKLNRDICYMVKDDSSATDPIRSDGNKYSRIKNVMEKAWWDQTRKEYSEMIPMFYGQLISQIKCGCCTKIHHNYELFSDLSLPIDDNCNTLYDCFDAHFKDEVVNKEERLWKCDKCEKKCESEKCTVLWKMPTILIVSLKRFSATTMRKNAKNIDIPMELDMSKYCLGDKKYVYNLKSAGVHMGFSQMGGHYYAMCQGYDGYWYKIDDLDVKMEKEKEPDVRNGYVYFYVLKQ